MKKPGRNTRNTLPAPPENFDLERSGQLNEKWKSGVRPKDCPLVRKMEARGKGAGKPPKLGRVERIKVWMINEGPRRLFVIGFLLLHIMVFSFGFLHYRFKDSQETANGIFGLTYPIARSAALTLHVDVALILLPVCRTIVSYGRRSRLNGAVQFDKNITLHVLIGWSIFTFSWIHTMAHWVNLARFALANGLGFKGFLMANFMTGPGWTGYVMLTALTAMVWTSIEKNRRGNFERFWYTHHLFVVFFVFWSFHGAFCMIKPDYAPFCSGISTFWKYWTLGGVLYLGERIVREIRGAHSTKVTMVVRHPNKVIELRIDKTHTRARAGQYIFLCCPAVSPFQYHPFTLTSAPEESVISVHVRCVGDWTMAMANSFGCDFTKEIDQDEEFDKGPQDVTASIFPHIMVDGPFGAASEDVFNYRVVLLIGAGIGVTPFASILKSIWYRMTYPEEDRLTRLRKVYFVWTSKDFESFFWFADVLAAIEEKDPSCQIELMIQCTDKKLKDVLTLQQLATGNFSEMDTLTQLHTHTRFGRPDWDAIFPAIKETHGSETSEERFSEAGVFFCGPKALSSILHVKCNKYSDSSFGFVWNKENF